MFNRIAFGLITVMIALVGYVTLVPDHSQSEPLTDHVDMLVLQQKEEHAADLERALEEDSCDRLMDIGSPECDQIVNSKEPLKVRPSENKLKYQDRLLPQKDRSVDPTEYDPTLTDSLFDDFDAEEHRFIERELDQTSGQLI